MYITNNDERESCILWKINNLFPLFTSDYIESEKQYNEKEIMFTSFYT
jgi:hypothetical protein